MKTINLVLFGIFVLIIVISAKYVDNYLTLDHYKQMYTQDRIEELDKRLHQLEKQ